MMNYKAYEIGSFETSNLELVDIAKAWFAISLAFAIAFRGSYGFSLQVFLISLFTAGLGFLLHELGHKVLAQKYGCHAEFRSFDKMLIFALIVSFFGFIFAAPGAVMIRGVISKGRNGKISLMGPAVNMALALVFLILGSLYPNLGLIAKFGFSINAWLGFFNMLPFLGFDGSKVLAWNKAAYGTAIGISIVLVGLSFVF